MKFYTGRAGYIRFNFNLNCYAHNIDTTIIKDIKVILPKNFNDYLYISIINKGGLMKIKYYNNGTLELYKGTTKITTTKDFKLLKQKFN